MGILGTVRDALLPAFTPASGTDPDPYDDRNQLTTRIQRRINRPYIFSKVTTDFVQEESAENVGTTLDIASSASDIGKDIGETTADVTTDAWEDRSRILELLQYLIIAVVGLAGVFVVSELLDGIGTVTGEEG
jgi:hypothetical protein